MNAIKCTGINFQAPRHLHNLHKGQSIYVWPHGLGLGRGLVSTMSFSDKNASFSNSQSLVACQKQTRQVIKINHFFFRERYQEDIPMLIAQMQLEMKLIS